MFYWTNQVTYEAAPVPCIVEIYM